jgi:hypothetical protein
MNGEIEGRNVYSVRRRWILELEFERWDLVLSWESSDLLSSAKLCFFIDEP